jgi:hypothetical protein
MDHPVLCGKAVSVAAFLKHLGTAVPTRFYVHVMWRGVLVAVPEDAAGLRARLGGCAVLAECGDPTRDPGSIAAIAEAAHMLRKVLAVADDPEVVVRDMAFLSDGTHGAPLGSARAPLGSARAPFPGVVLYMTTSGARGPAYQVFRRMDATMVTVPRDGSPWRVKDVLGMAGAVLRALAAMHSARYAHRNVTSSSVLFRGRRFALGAFGLALPQPLLARHYRRHWADRHQPGAAGFVSPALYASVEYYAAAVMALHASGALNAAPLYAAFGLEDAPPRDQLPALAQAVYASYPRSARPPRSARGPNRLLSRGSDALVFEAYARSDLYALGLCILRFGDLPWQVEDLAVRLVRGRGGPATAADALLELGACRELCELSQCLDDPVVLLDPRDKNGRKLEQMDLFMAQRPHPPRPRWAYGDAPPAPPALDQLDHWMADTRGAAVPASGLGTPSPRAVPTATTRGSAVRAAVPASGLGTPSPRAVPTATTRGAAVFGSGSSSRSRSGASRGAYRSKTPAATPRRTPRPWQP